jgi:hypothetical protein
VLSWSLVSESYTHGSAQNIGVITQSMCDQLVNTCKADATARGTCAKALAAASAATPAKTGIQADAFNAVFGIITTFADDPVFDDQGNLVSGTLNNGGNNNSTDPSNGGGNTCNGGSNTGNNGSGTPANNTGNADPGNIGNFGSCSVPEIEFGVGFDNRRETSFRPVDLGESNPPPPSTYATLPKRFPLTLSILGRSELQPRFRTELRHHRPIRLRPAREQVWSRRYRSCHLCSS